MRPPALLMACIFIAWHTMSLGAAGLPSGENPSHAYRPMARPAVPRVKGVARTDIDRFLLAKLEPKGWGFSPEADRATLIRRVSFILTGLPPTLAESAAFENDRTPGAHGRMVEKYLASPHYGIRMGKMWLDAAGYADSNGYFNADSDRPLAWKYRDYVISSFNADKPYDKFVMEQLAGDELANFKPGGDAGPEVRESLIATHFLRNAPDGTGESDGNPDEVLTDRFTVLEGNLQNMANSLLGLTIQCARCHDHKFEPISQAEYYGMQALFFPVYNPGRWSKPNERVVVAATVAEREAWQKASDAIDRQIRNERDELARKSLPLRRRWLEERLGSVKESLRGPILEAWSAPGEKRSKAQADLLKAHASLVEFKDEEIAKKFPAFAAEREKTEKEVKRLEGTRPPPLEKISAFVETDPQPPVHRLLRRGVHTKPGEEVQPGVIAALESPSNRFEIAPKPKERVSSGRRLAFARWVTSPVHPMLARVMVNRIWQHHFGTGIVSTVDNLGVSGAKPSHPELLDHLALEFIRQGFSVKNLHRMILASAVSTQSSAPAMGGGADDPDNRLLSRFPLRRLDAESIRDSMLMVSGELDGSLGGPYVPSRREADGTVQVSEAVAGARRRSVYLQQRRTQVVTFLQLFDAPAMVSTCGKRSPSTVPLQSLVLLNSEFARSRAASFAGRLAREAGDDAFKRLSLAFRLACGREPGKEEEQACVKFLAAQAEAYRGAKDGKERTWADLCQMLLASNAFLHVE